MVLIEGENDRRLKDLYLHLVVEYRPMGFEENLLVSEISKTLWRKNRFQTAEANALVWIALQNEPNFRSCLGVSR